MRKRHPILTVCGVILIVLVIGGGITALVGWGLGWFDNEETEVVEGEDDPETNLAVVPGTGIVITDGDDNDGLLHFDEELTEEE